MPSSKWTAEQTRIPSIMEQVQVVQNKIYEIRGQRVMLDRDLAELYGVETKVMNQTVKRNIERFPERFMFQLTKEECLRSQIVTLNESPSKLSRGQHLKYLPYVFTEQGVSMLSAVLRSPTAVRVCIVIMDAYVAMRTSLPATSSPSDLATTLSSIDRRLAQLEQAKDPPLALPRHRNTPTPLPETALPEYLSRDVRVVGYSERALAIFTDDPEDHRLLKALGARFNCWLTWQDARCAGWVYPKSRANDLIRYIQPLEEKRKR